MTFANNLFELAKAMPISIVEPLNTRQQKQKYVKKLGNETLRAKDARPLQAGVLRVYEIMADHNWHTIPELRERSGLECPDRRMRQLRSCGYTIEKRRIDDSRAFEYRLKFDVTI